MSAPQSSPRGRASSGGAPGARMVERARRGSFWRLRPWGASNSLLPRSPYRRRRVTAELGACSHIALRDDDASSRDRGRTLAVGRRGRRGAGGWRGDAGWTTYLKIYLIIYLVTFRSLYAFIQVSAFSFVRRTERAGVRRSRIGGPWAAPRPRAALRRLRVEVDRSLFFSPLY